MTDRDAGVVEGPAGSAAGARDSRPSDAWGVVRRSWRVRESFATARDGGRTVTGCSGHAAGQRAAMTVQITGISRLRLTVTDIARPRAFYEEVFGFPVALEPPPAGAPQERKNKTWFLFGGVIYALPGGLIMGLRPVAATGDRFDADRVGLEHLCFGVSDRASREDAAALLEARGVAHGGVKDIGSMFILESRHPDDNALELSAPTS